MGPLLLRSIRLKVVTAALVVVPEEAGPGMVTTRQVAADYRTKIEGTMNGEVIQLWAGCEGETVL